MTSVGAPALPVPAPAPAPATPAVAPAAALPPPISGLPLELPPEVRPPPLGLVPPEAGLPPGAPPPAPSVVATAPPTPAEPFDDEHPQSQTALARVAKGKAARQSFEVIYSARDLPPATVWVRRLRSELVSER